MTEREDTYTAEDRLLPIGDVAKLLGVHVETVRRWEAAGHLTATRTPGGQRRFWRSDVVALIASAPS